MGPTMTWTLAQTAPENTAPADAPPMDAPPADAPPSSADSAPVGTTTTIPGEVQQPAPSEEVVGGGGNQGNMFMLILFGAIIFMLAMSWMTNRKERKGRAEMLSKLSKGDEVQMVGGERGKVVELRDDEVVLKVDENSNTRIRFARAAIQNVLSEPKGS